MKDYFLLPNGKKINLKDFYNSVTEENLTINQNTKLLFDYYSESEDNILDSNQTNHIFETSNQKAEEDSNNELSFTEILGLVRSRNLDIKEEEVEILLSQLSDKSDNEEKTASIIIKDIFPELIFTGFCTDYGVDLSKLNIENIKKLFKPDESSFYENSREYYRYTDSKGRIKAVPVDLDFDLSKFPDGEKIVRTYKLISSSWIEIIEDKGDVHPKYKDKIAFYFPDDKSIHIEFTKDGYNISSEDRVVNIRGGKIIEAKTKDKTFDFNSETKNAPKYLTTKEENNDKGNWFVPIYDSNGEIIRKDKNNTVKIEDYIYIKNIANLLASKKCEIDALSKEINKVLDKGNIGLLMDDYYLETGRELIDELNNASMSDKEKTELLNKICEPYVDSKYYDANKKIEHSHIKNEYYTSSDEYSIEYNGPIINVYNKTTNSAKRINLKSLSDSKKEIIRLDELQKLSGEVLENIAIELKTVNRLNSKPFSSTRGEYLNNDKIFLYTSDPSTLVHELGHAIEDSASYKTFTSYGKFKQVFDQFIKEYTSSGHKRFLKISLFNLKSNYATYDEHEAFAIAMQILMGQKDDPHTKWLKKNAPELIKASKELYLEIRNKSVEERR